MSNFRESDGSESDFKKILQINTGEMQTQVRGYVRNAVEEALNSLLDAEADELCGAKRYERNDTRKDTRAGSYSRKLMTSSGEVKLKVPKLRTLQFESAIIQRYQRRECSVEEALVEMYFAGVSVRRVEDITQALWGARVSPSTISELNQKIYDKIEESVFLPRLPICYFCVTIARFVLAKGAIHGCCGKRSAFRKSARLLARAD